MTDVLAGCLLAIAMAACSSDVVDDGGVESDSSDSPAADVSSLGDTPTLSDDTPTLPDDTGAADDSTATGDVEPDAGPMFECPPQTGQRPGAISEHAGIFDPIKQRIVFHGGNPEPPVNCIGKNSFVAETWAYYPQCDVWVEIADSPSARGRATAIYDPVGQAMIMFGGRFRAKGADPMTTPYTLNAEVWRLDLSSDKWTQVATLGTGPSARVNASAIYDPKSHRMVLFGGNTSTSGASYVPQNDLFALDLATFTWEPLAAAGAPSKRLFAAAAYDSKRHALVISQGGDEVAFTGPFLGDTWSLDLDSLQWTLLHPGVASQPAPDRRIWGRATYHPGLDRLLLFGGHDDGLLGNRNDFWMFSLATNTWQSLAVGDTHNAPANGQCDFPPEFVSVAAGTPERRGSHLSLYWEAENSLVIHGGKTDCGVIDDVWAYSMDSSEWTDLSPATLGEVCLRYADASQCTSLCN
ncbi:MAG: hypothetical protein ACI9OJ_002312 [Myxococcota bacterium]|jgi:hypothetical protein